MRAVKWESSPGALVALLNSGAPLEKADLYTLTLGSGAVLRYSGSDVAITLGADTWALGPGFARSRVRMVVGVEVDSLTVTLTDVASTTLNGVALIPFVAQGGLQGARLELDRAFWPFGATTPTGTLPWFAGRVADVQRFSRYEATLRVVSDLELLDAMIPRDVYQAGCPNTEYDSNCGASRSAFTVTGAATSSTDARRLTFSHAMAQAAGYFDLGAITMTSGACAGITRTVRTHTASQFTVMQPWPAAVAASDTFSVWPGCNKSLTDANGCPKFHSASVRKQRFRGTPFVPVPETVT